jgi:enterochelin esterase-like enzyme
VTTRRTPPKLPRPTPVPRVRSELVDRLSADDLDTFWGEIATTLPLIEEAADGSIVVTFCWREDPDDPAESVLLFANRLTDETHLADTLLERKPGTDLWHASFRMEAGWRASYSFLVQSPGRTAPWIADGHAALRAALDQGRLDSRNPRTCRNRAGVLQSVAEGPHAPTQPWLAERPGVARGQVIAHEAPGARRVWLYEPPGVGPEDELPLVVVLDGEVWTGAQSLPTTLDNMIADGAIGPVRAVFLPSGGRDARWSGLSADGTEADYVADELIGWARRERGVLHGPAAVTVVGQSLGGLTALRLGLTRTEAVGNVVSHSASLWQDPLLDLTPTRPLRVHLAHGAQEWVLAPPHEALAARLTGLGVDLDVAVHDGGHDYAWWRGGVADGLQWVLGPAE